MPDWTTMFSFAALGLGTARLPKMWIPTLDFLHRCIETLHRNRQERLYQRQYQKIRKKQLKESSGDALRELADDHTEKRAIYVGNEKSSSEPEETASDDEGDERHQNTRPALKGVKRSALVRSQHLN